MSRVDLRTAVLLTMPPLLWAGNALVGRLAVGSVPPLTLNFLRWALAALILLPLGWRVLRQPRDIMARWPHLMLLGLLGVGTYNAMQYLALVTSTPINVTLIAASLPVWMLAVGAAFYSVQPTRRQALGAALSVAGVLLVIARGDVSALARVHFVRGDLYVVVATVAWALYSWRLARPPASMQPPNAPRIAVDHSESRRDGNSDNNSNGNGGGNGTRDWNWAELLLLQTLFGLLVAGAGAAGEVALGAAPIQWNGWVLAALLYVAVGPSVVAYRCWGLGVASGGPAMAAFFSNLTPLFAAVLSAAVLGEAPQWFHAIAFALIVGGIVVSARRGA